MEKITSHPIIKNGHNIVLALASILLIAVLFYAAFFVSDTNKVKAGVTHNVSGWAWSDNVGWISFNCIDTSSCDTVDYGVNLAPDGVLSGYAWYGWEYCIEYDEPPNDDICIATEKIGNWISFNEAELVGNNLEGWARACSVFKNGCSGELKSDDLTGGWEGRISLNKKPSDTYDYGVTKNGNNLEGYAWDAIQDPFIQCDDGIDNDGDEDIDLDDSDCVDATDKTEGVGVQIGIGWIDFNPAFSGGGVMITPNSVPIVTLSANPVSVLSGGDPDDTWSELTWSSSNATDCVGTVGPAGWLDDGNSKALFGSEDVGPHTIDTVYRITCTNSTSSRDDDATVFVDDGSGSFECSDSIDNTDPEDILIDANDPGCYDTGGYDANDDDETDTLPECSNFFDDDGDGFIDFSGPNPDSGCSSADDDREQNIGFEEF